MITKRTIVLELDEPDWNVIQNEFARAQRMRRPDGNGGTTNTLPDGESNLAGAIVAERFRDLQDYRDLVNGDAG